MHGSVALGSFGVVEPSPPAHLPRRTPSPLNADPCSTPAPGTAASSVPVKSTRVGATCTRSRGLAPAWPAPRGAARPQGPSAPSPLSGAARSQAPSRWPRGPLALSGGSATPRGRPVLQLRRLVCIHVPPLSMGTPSPTGAGCAPVARVRVTRTGRARRPRRTLGPGQGRGQLGASAVRALRSGRERPRSPVGRVRQQQRLLQKPQNRVSEVGSPGEGAGGPWRRELAGG